MLNYREFFNHMTYKQPMFIQYLQYNQFSKFLKDFYCSKFLFLQLINLCSISMQTHHQILEISMHHPYAYRKIEQNNICKPVLKSNIASMDIENDHNTPIGKFFSHYGHNNDEHYHSDQISQTAQNLKLLLYKHHSSCESKLIDTNSIVTGQFYLHSSEKIDNHETIKGISNQSLKKTQSDHFQNANNLASIILAITNKHLIFYSFKQGFLKNIQLKHFQSSAIKLHYWCQISFDIKFEILRENWTDQFTPGLPKGIKFQRPINNILNNPTQKPQYLSLQLFSTPQIIESVTQPLQHRLNQRNFHNLFKAQKKIGKGAFATVYLAERLLDKRKVAVKAFSKQKQFSTKNGKQALINQIKLLRDIEHKNILKLLQIFETDNSLYMLMDNLEGGHLDQRIKFATKKYADQLPRQLFSNTQIKMIIKSLLQATSYLNKLGIIHRDLKPQNIMFKYPDSFEAVLCDFGLATYANQQSYLFVRCGTPGFVAPEIINIKDMNTKSDPISDVFSVGVIMHILLFGVSIFPGKKYNDILTQNRACDFNFTTEMYQNYLAKGDLCEHQAYELMKRMLERNPKNRINAEKALTFQYFNDKLIQQNRRSLSNAMDIEQYSDTSKFESQKFSSSRPKNAFNYPEGVIKRGSQTSRIQNIILGQNIPLKHIKSSDCNANFHSSSEKNGHYSLSKNRQIQSPRYIKIADHIEKYNKQKMINYPHKNIDSNLFEPFAQENKQNFKYRGQSQHISALTQTKKPHIQDKNIEK